MALLTLSLAFGAAQAGAAGVSTLDNLTRNLTIREINDRVGAYKSAATSLEHSLEKLTSSFDMSSPAKVAASLQFTRQTQEQLTGAQKAVTALSDYVALNGSGLKDGAKYLPLAYVKAQLETPYHQALESFLAASDALLEYADRHFGEISTGMQPQRSSYEELYRLYLTALDRLNEALSVRERELGGWLKRYPDLRDSLPQ